MGIRAPLKQWLSSWFFPIPRPEKWVFVVGCYNSGTTLLHDIVASHPLVGSLPKEGQYLTNQLVLPESVGLPRLWALEEDRFSMGESAPSRSKARKIKRQWGSMFDNPRKPVLLEKSPTNAGRTRWLQQHFEQAHFIGIIRNGYVVTEGIHRKAGHSLRAAALQWARSNEIMLRDFEHLRCKKLVRYEYLTENPDLCLSELLSFIGLDTRELTVGDRTWKVHERVSSIKNMNEQSLERLTEPEYEIIDEAAGFMLRRLGYARSQDERPSQLGSSRGT